MSEPQKHLGILSALSEAAEISKELGVSFDEALKISSDRSAARLQEIEDERERAEKVIQFRPRGA
jgi:hypothetical protein